MPAWSPTISGLPPECVPATVWVVVAVVGAALELLDGAGLLAAALLAVAVLLEPVGAGTAGGDAARQRQSRQRGRDSSGMRVDGDHVLPFVFTPSSERSRLRRSMSSW